MRFVVDARYVGPRPSGIGEYVRALGSRLPRLAPEANLHFWVRRAVAPFAFGERVSYETVQARPTGLATLLAPGLLGKVTAEDVFHAPANILGFGLPSPAIVTVHDLMWLEHVEWCQPRPWLRPVSRRYYGTAIRHALRAAARVLTVSSASADAIVRLFPEVASKLVVTRNACEQQFQPPASLEVARAEAARVLGGVQPYFLVVGQNQPSKAHDVAVRAFAAIAGQVKERLVLVQRLDPGRGLHGLAHALHVGHRVAFVTGLQQAELVAVLQSATALLQPSLGEGFGLPALEAMACGCPVVGSDIPALREVLGSAGTFVAPGDVEGLAKGALLLATDEARRSELRACGMERAASFSWDDTAALTWQVYREVAERR